MSAIPGHECEIGGILSGNTVRAKHLVRDIISGPKNAVGGELNEYTGVLSDVRQESLKRMINDAKRVGPTPSSMSASLLPEWPPEPQSRWRTGRR